MKTSVRIMAAATIALLVGAIVTASRQSIATPRIQTATIRITERGFEPETVRLRKAVQARITFLRTTDATCAKEIMLPDFKIKRELPLNQPVVVSVTPRKSGALTFACGMDMMRGQLIVQ